jgi:site-specific DNA recombinase
MGGLPPLGYDLPLGKASRALVANEGEARAVRQIFNRCLELGSLVAVQKALQQDGIRSKHWVTAAGRRMGGLNFSRGALRHLLTNRVYVGEIGHKGERFPGRHQAILDVQTFDAVQAVLAHRSQAKRTRIPKAHACILHGLVFDGDGHRMEPVVATRPGKAPYRYYAAAGGVERHQDAITRVPADVLETLVSDRIAGLIGALPGKYAGADIRVLIARVEVHSNAVHMLIRNGASIATGMRITQERLRGVVFPGDQVRVDLHDTAGNTRHPARPPQVTGRQDLADQCGRHAVPRSKAARCRVDPAPPGGS